MLKGKTALIAGASRGIGLAIARAMAEAGAHTLLASRSLEKLKTIAADMHGTAIELRHRIAPLHPRMRGRSRRN